MKNNINKEKKLYTKFNWEYLKNILIFYIKTGFVSLILVSFIVFLFTLFLIYAL